MSGRSVIKSQHRRYADGSQRRDVDNYELRITNYLWRAVVLAAVVGMFCGAAARGAIIGDIVRVGYLVSSGSVIRTGAWTPIVVDLALENQTAFDGLLRLRQFDRDGDIYVDTVPVHLADTGDGARQRYWLYTVANPQNAREYDFEVEVLATETGEEAGAERVQVISGGVPVSKLVPPMRPESLSDDAYLILEISDRPLGKVSKLLEPVNQQRIDREIAIAHGSPADLPSNWIGLEMVDYLLWENADTTRLTPAQEQALAEWVRQGGRLVLAAGRTSDALAQSDVFGPLLPVRVGRVRTTTDLPTVRRRLLGFAEADANKGYPRSVVYAACAVLDEPDVKDVLFDEAAQATIVASRRVGRGKLVFVAAPLGELLAGAGVDVVLFFSRLLELRTNAVTDEAANTTYVNLFEYLDREVAYTRTGAARLAAALLFAVAYVLVATLGAWKILHAKDWLRQSWSALAVTAIAATIISLIGVQVIHGVGRDVHQLTIVDGVANSVAARATAYFGVNTATHSHLDFWLPADYRLDTEPAATACTLKPMLEPKERLEAGAAFTDPGRYWLLPSTAEVHNVPVRATLKQFEGRWRGDLRGTVLSSVTAVADVELALADGQQREDAVGLTIAPPTVYGFSRDSWIENGLQADLEDCQLFFVDDDLVSLRTWGILNQRGGPSTSPMYAFRLGTIESGERINLHDSVFLGAGGVRLTRQQYDAQLLKSAQLGWGKYFIDRISIPGFGNEEPPDYRFDHYQYALLLATVMADVDPGAWGPSPYAGIRVFSRTRLRQLDISDLVQQHSALLVGFTRDPGPARICARTSGKTDYEPIEPVNPRTVYRFLIPVNPPVPARK